MKTLVVSCLFIAAICFTLPAIAEDNNDNNCDCDVSGYINCVLRGEGGA